MMDENLISTEAIDLNTYTQLLRCIKEGLPFKMILQFQITYLRI